MSELRVTAERLEILPHPDPDVDRMEVAVVGLYQAVVPKGRYVTGDWAVYIPEGAIVPADLLAENGLTGKLAGPGLDRVKAQKFRGVLSQGLVVSPSVLRGTDLAQADAEGVDFKDALGIVKYVPEVPEHFQGAVEAAPDLLRWIEIDDIKRCPSVFEPGEMVTVTEKIHGTAMIVTWYADGDRIQVSSAGLAHERMALSRPGPGDRSNVYWDAVLHHDVHGALRHIGRVIDQPRISVHCEVYGDGVQKGMGYGADARSGAPGIAVYDVQVSGFSGMRWWLSRRAIRQALQADGEGGALRLPLVPLLFEGAYDRDWVMQLASGKEQVSGKELHIREGVVVRAMDDRDSGACDSGRAIVKVVSPDFLMSKKGTDYK
jgi:RNA ligase (TIGR02306 family)